MKSLSLFMYIAHAVRVVDDIDEQDELGRTKLIKAVMAVEFEEACDLISRGANLDIKEHTYGGTALFHACKIWSDSHPYMVQLLIDSQADVNARTKTGSTPLRQATLNGFSMYVQLLLEKGCHPDLQTDDSYQNPILEICADKEYFPIPITTRQTILHQIIKHRANLEIRGKGRDTPLIRASKTKSFSPLVSMLCDAGANLDAQDVNGMTPLMHSVEHACDTNTKQLLDYGCNIEVRDIGDRNAYSISMRRNRRTARSCIPPTRELYRMLRGEQSESNIQTLRRVLLHGAKITARDENGKNAIEYLLQRPSNAITCEMNHILFQRLLSVIKTAAESNDLETIKASFNKILKGVIPRADLQTLQKVSTTCKTTAYWLGHRHISVTSIIQQHVLTTLCENTITLVLDNLVQHTTNTFLRLLQRHMKIVVDTLSSQLDQHTDSMDFLIKNPALGIALSASISN